MMCHLFLASIIAENISHQSTATGSKPKKGVWKICVRIKEEPSQLFQNEVSLHIFVKALVILKSLLNS